MQVRRFEFEQERRTERRAEPSEEAYARPAMRAAPERDGDDPRDDETIDEPGYGHGV